LLFQNLFLVFWLFFTLLDLIFFLRITLDDVLKKCLIIASRSSSIHGVKVIHGWDETNPTFFVVKYSIEGLHKLVTHHPLRLTKARAHLHITWVKHKFTVSITLIPHVSFTGHNEWFTCLIILVCHDSQFERW